jgi:hypothetical protein
LTTFLILSCSSKIYEATSWQNNKVEIDGKTTEWKIPFRYFDGTTQLNYQFSNDGENLYFAARTSNKELAQQILISGLKIEIDTNVKSNEYPFSLKFPVMSRPPMGRNPIIKDDFNLEHDYSEKSDKSDNMQFNNDRLIENQFNEIQLCGFNNRTDEEEIVLISEAGGINAQAQPDSLGFLFFEAVIPFKTFYKDHLSPKDTSSVFCFRISMDNTGIPKMTNEGPDNQGGNGPGMKSTGMGGGPGMGGQGMKGPGGAGGPGNGGPGMNPGGGSPGEDKEQDSNTDKKSEISLKLHLAFKSYSSN